MKYQFDGHECDDNEVFDFDPEERNVELKHIPTDTVPVDIAIAQHGWRICHFHTLKPKPTMSPTAPPNNLVQFIKSQPEHISQYYAYIKWEVPEAEVYKMLIDTKEIIMATDGGAKAFKGSIGFVITNKQHKVLMSCYGRTAGHDPLSFRTEASAFLAALRVILLIAEYYKEEPTGELATNKEMTLFTDSLSMKKKLTAMNKYPTAHLKCTMDPEWDILQAIHSMMGKMKEQPTLEWVRSHQDDDPNEDISKLSRAAQLNIKADALATQGLNKLASNPIVPLDPSVEVLLHQRGRTITRDYKVSMRNNIQLLVLEEYYQKRFGWTNTEYGKIDWSTFTPVYRRAQNKHRQWTNKFCMKKLSVGQRIHARESKHDARCCSCWAESETDDHVLRCKHRSRFRTEIYQLIKRLGKEMDPVLLEILLDGVMKYLSGTRQTKYIVGSSRRQQTSYWDRIREASGIVIPPNEEHDYWQLQRNQEAIGWDNLLRGKFAKDWRKLNGVYNRKLKDIQREKDKAQRERKQRREAEEQQRNPYWDPTRPTKKRKMEKPEKKVRKADVFQRVFAGIIRIIRELWLERNTDRHQPLQGQKRMAKITEATRTVTDLYSLQSMIMPEHMSKYFAMPLEEMVEQSAPRMLAWATRWKMGIYQSVRRAKYASKQMTVPIWKIWDPDRTDEPAKKVDKRRLKQTKQKKYKASSITDKLKVTGSIKSTSRVTDRFKRKTYLQATFDDLEVVMMEKNPALYGDAFND